jgi:Na+/H+-dicarboxylate symporter
MCANHPQPDSSFLGKVFGNMNILFAVAILCGLCTGYLNDPAINEGAKAVSHVFISLLKLVSLPIFFLSILATASGMENISEIKSLGKKVVTYTLLTTVLAAAIALVFFVLFDPVRSKMESTITQPLVQGSYWSYLLNVVPSNIEIGRAHV